jgi:uncharacterized membrane protein YphA (DoxX/SURF4 family)
MNKIRKYLPWTIRILIFIVFIVSAVSKMFPLWSFEKQMVDLGIASWCQAAYLSRFIIAAEIAIGIAILQNHFIKRLVIPATVLLLAAFCVHLAIQMVKYGPMNGNCGCFGQVIPMTPLEAFIKNVISIGLLVYLYRNVTEKEKGKNRFVYLLLFYIASSLFMFVLFPFCPCAKEEIKSSVVVNEGDSVVKDTIIIDSLSVKGVNEKVDVKDKAELEKVIEYGPKKVVSRFSKHSNFGSKKVKLDEGKKVICLFAPGCDHCLETANSICALSAAGGIPEVYIFFMDEETEKIPDFFKAAKCNFPYQIINIPEFWNLMGSDGNTPGIFCMWNGNIIKSFEGNEKNKYDAQVFKNTWE